MSSRLNHLLPAIAIPNCQAVEITVGQLFAQVYSAASPNDQLRLLAHLNQALAVPAVSPHVEGPINKIGAPGATSALGHPRASPGPVDAADVADLFDRAHQSSSASLAGLAHVVAASPILAGTPAATLLVAVLARNLTEQAAHTEVAAAAQGTAAAQGIAAATQQSC